MSQPSVQSIFTSAPQTSPFGGGFGASANNSGGLFGGGNTSTMVGRASAPIPTATPIFGRGAQQN
ncbi:hypothetical protein EX30DRAFT_342469 [Ascodesmis nigricans]|uniref:Uncharacterized protein n=1 Tax=Ascodesmis nigricans TaxID=341454 RepID=A0A4S2MQ91_9PEZI|nr:hypothetical protein EX30DRAFT_342469 [Ascodesmis nigricans]